MMAMTMGLVHFEGRFGLAFLMLLASPVTVFAAPAIMAIYDTHFGEGLVFHSSSAPQSLLIFGRSVSSVEPSFWNALRRSHLTTGLVLPFGGEPL